MSRGRWTEPVGALFVLDAQPLSLLADDENRMVALLDVALREGYLPAVSAVTIAEVRRSGGAARRLRWLRSRLRVIPVTEEIADEAARLLEETRLDGHECVVDALVVATAAASSGMVKVASSDASHVAKMCAAASLDRPSPVGWVRV
ncbi:PIN domain-containing protein [Streptomyces sp. ST2-7A]|uniref:PIN domain-containing protein n=1 Tax=Streptomyces sp. ST2-7A TaxID=2907214 RepID=UPI00227926AF|nr:PIN domain-containing protein [Streptomyces sp. ST2-7A]MCE7080190.1 PIN domain-containing protein [Streptomyces sp. ST2-7A]